MKKIILPTITSLFIVSTCLSTQEEFTYIPSRQVMQNEIDHYKRLVDQEKTETKVVRIQLSNLRASSGRKAKRREERITGLKEQVKKYENELQQLKSDVKEKEEKIAGLQKQAKQYDGDLKGFKRDLAEAKKTNEEIKLSKNAIKKEHKLIIEAFEKGYKEEIFRLKQEIVSLILKNSRKNNMLLSLVDTSVQTDDLSTSPTPIPDIISVSKEGATNHQNDFSMPVSEDKSRGEEKGWSTPQVARISILGAIITLLVYRLAKNDKQKENTPQDSLDKKNHIEEVR